jgi:hypothetical protein
MAVISTMLEYWQLFNQTMVAVKLTDNQPQKRINYQVSYYLPFLSRHII